MTRHKHADVLIAMAEGKEIEFFDVAVPFIAENCGEWLSPVGLNPLFDSNLQWRVKPKPDVVMFGVATIDEEGFAYIKCLGPLNQDENNNIKLTFGGNDELKEVELIK